MIVLRAPGGCDRVAQLARKSGALERYVAEHRHHVDHEWLALGAVQRRATTLVDQAEQVTGELDLVRGPPGRDRRADCPPPNRPDGWNRLGWTSELPIRLLPTQLDEARLVAGDVDRNPIGRRKHRLDRQRSR